MRFTAEQLRALSTHIIERTEKLVPDDVRLKVTDHSTRNKLHLLFKIEEHTLFLIWTKGDRLEVAADETVHPIFQDLDGPEPYGPFNPAIAKMIKRVVARRLPWIQERIRLNLPLRDFHGVQAQRNRDGTLSLQLDNLSFDTYDKILRAILPILKPSRFDREPPV